MEIRDARTPNGRNVGPRSALRTYEGRPEAATLGNMTPIRGSGRCVHCEKQVGRCSRCRETAKKLEVKA